jgi:ATP-dependent DNA helicase RecG
MSAVTAKHAAAPPRGLPVPEDVVVGIPPCADPEIAERSPSQPVEGNTLGLAFASTRSPTRAELLAAPVRWPRPSRLEQPLKGPTGKSASGLRALGVETVGALLEHLPRDRREARTVAELCPGEQATVAVEVESIAVRPVRRRGMRPLVEATVFDETGAMSAAFFNQPWLVDRYRSGTRLLLHGKSQKGGRFAVASHALSGELGAGRSPLAGERQAVAHYPAAEGVSSTQIVTLMREHRGALADVDEPLPARIRAVERLPDRAAALAAMHFPATAEEAESGRARLAFEELLLMQLALLRRRALRGSGTAAPLVDGSTLGHRELSRRWLEELLPFRPTDDQLAAIAAVDADLERARPMQRLLMGEVGSGKTVVALYALLRAVEHGMQGALMAPTETLAEQHFATLQALIPEVLLPTALLTGSTPMRRRVDLLGKLASGELKLVVGTHALIEEDVVFDRLAVAVVDEQHRFGVRQRVALDRKGPTVRVRESGAGEDGTHEPGEDCTDGPAGREGPLAHAPARTGRLEADRSDVPAVPLEDHEAAPRSSRLAPHVLHMTATPIPRTLALTAYGDLDVTRLRELPKGRRPIATHVASSEAERARAYERIREELRAGRQAYVVCPLVEESQELQGRAAIAEYERLRTGELREFRLELLHGQLRPREKQRAMARFAAGAADVLVATTVIEVGIDVPNATVMLVEDAERYGISQLHQLRGRIGRGEHPSVCLLLGPRNARRLRALAEHRDGFKLAEIDLELRGEGELAGTRQHGQGIGARPPYVVSLPQDTALLEHAREWAMRLLAADPTLTAPEHAPLGAALERALGNEAHDPLPA